MLNLSEVLMKEGDRILSFNELKIAIQKAAQERREMYFTIDIEPPPYPDRPEDWYEQLEIAFSLG